MTPRIRQRRRYRSAAALLASLAKRLDEHSTPEPVSDCLLWSAHLDCHGYGRVWDGVIRRMALAHRVSWQIHRGPIPSGMFVLHKCDVPACINPDHLFLGTQAENMADMARKGRQSRGEQHSERFSEDIILQIRSAEGLQRDIAERFGLSQRMVSDIKARRRWRHV